MNFSAQSEEYYPLLARGFLHGHLSLDKNPSPEFLALEDPWDPAKAGSLRLPDASYYKGKYYLYFGPAPVLLLFLPSRVILGLYPSHSVAVVIFCLLGYGLNLVLLRGIRRRHFPGTSLAWLVAAACVLGFGSAVPQMIRRPDVWEVAISCGYFSLSAGLCAAYLAIIRRSPLWMAVGGLCFGLAIASRPTLLLCPLVLVFPAYAALRDRVKGQGMAPALLGTLAPPVLVMGAFLLGLFLYNYERFGDPLEFGQRYQLHARDERHTPSLSPRFIPFNARIYFICPPRLSSRFPFVDGIDIPDRPKGQLGFEDVYGLIPTMPALLAGLAVLGLCRRATRVRYPGLGLFTAGVATLALASCAFILLFAGACNRYEVDFAPYLSLLAAVGILFLVQELGPQGGMGKAVRTALGAACVLTVACSTLVSIEHNSILKTRNEGAWRALSRVFNYLPFLIDRASGLRSGPVEVSLSFPDRDSGEETLLTSGRGEGKDTLVVHYLGKGLVRLGMDHEGFGGPTSPTLAVGSGTTHTLVLDMGPLYPDYDFQYYSGRRGIPSETLQMRLLVNLDGRVVFDRSAAYDDANVADTRWGWEAKADAGHRFTGRILGFRWLNTPVAVKVRDPRKPIDLRVRFPGDRTHAHEPLVSTGRIGRADILYVDYVDRGQVQFALDHWSAGTVTWPAVAIDYAKPHHLEISARHLSDGGSPTSIEVDLDGKRIIDEAIPLYPVTPSEIYVGYAPYLNSSCGLEFTGELRDADPPGAGTEP
jgi:hypothetical protein